MKTLRAVILPLLLPIGICALVFASVRAPFRRAKLPVPVNQSEIQTTVQYVDSFLEQQWRDLNLQPANRSDDLQILRRLSLALHGTIPSLEEIREFENDQQPDRLERWVSRLLSDKRFGEYFAQRLSRAMVGTEEGPFLVFRRGKLNEWLADQVQQDEAWDTIVTRLMTQTGLWTGQPATNFITVANMGDQEEDEDEDSNLPVVNRLDENMLTARTVRAFLGLRLDCVQCHDDLINGEWQQSQFHGLAAFYGQTDLSVFGIEDYTTFKDRDVEYLFEEPGEEPVVVQPTVPFHAEWLPEAGNRRQQLAAWVTHKENRRFDRAIVNRVWGLMFGRPFISPVDDLPAPPDSESERGILDILGDDFRANRSSLHHLIRTIAATRAFQMESTSPIQDEAEFRLADENWAVFPLIRLRPEQVIGTLLQSRFPTTINQNSHLFVRIQRYFGELDFIREYGDPGEDELAEQASTIPQALLRMNGEFTRESLKVDVFTAANAVLKHSRNDEQTVENSFLICLTRRPTAAEKEAFVDQLKNPKNNRREIVEDLFWTLFNSPEFSWNH